MENKNKLPEFLQTAEKPKMFYDDIIQSLHAISDGVLDGILDENISYLQLDTIAKLAKDLQNVIKESVISELQRNDGFMIRGEKVLKVQSGKAMYKFTSNPEYIKINNRKKEIESNMKGLVSVFEGQTNPFEVSEDGTIWNPSTGEQVYIAEKSYGKETIVITTKKSK